jgi:hypothetical protein
MLVKQLEFGKVIELNGEVIYTKNVERAPHFMRKFKSWGFQVEEVENMKPFKVTKVILNIKGEGMIETSFENVEKGRIDDFGHGNQHFVKEKLFKDVQEILQATPV